MVCRVTALGPFGALCSLEAVLGTPNPSKLVFQEPAVAIERHPFPTDVVGMPGQGYAAITVAPDILAKEVWRFLLARSEA